MGVYLTDVHLMGRVSHRRDLTGVHPIGVHLTGVHLIGVYFMGVYLTSPGCASQDAAVLP
jgi:hypothetical protein